MQGTLRNLRMASYTVSILFVLAASFTLSAPSHRLAIAELTDQDDIVLALKALSNAINAPTDFNMEILSSALPEESREETIDQIKRAFSSKSRVSGKSPGWFSNILLVPQQRSSMRDGVVLVTCELGILSHGIHAQDSVRITLKKRGNQFEITDAENITQIVLAKIARVEMDAVSSGRFRPGSKSKAAFSKAPPQSNNLLIPSAFYESYHRFGRVASLAENSGNALFSEPYGIMSVYWDDPFDAFDREFLMISDPGWNRLIASASDMWLQSFGSYGSGNGNVNRPLGIAWINDNGGMWAIADAFNNRALVYGMDWNTGDTSFQFSLEDNMSYVSDVAAARVVFSSNPLSDSTQIVVLDRGNARAVLFNKFGNPVSSYPIPGQMQLQFPVSVCFGRNWKTGHPISHIYIADAGLNAVIRYGLFYPYTYSHTPAGMFPSNADLVSIDADYFGNIYVLDNNNSTLYILTPSLDRVIATYGSTGTGDNQFYFPNSFAFAEGWRDDAAERNTPIRLGNAFASEPFTDYTGIRSYVLHGDAIEHSLEYEPMWRPGSNDYFRTNWYTTAACRCTVKVFHQFSPVDPIEIMYYPVLRAHVKSCVNCFFKQRPFRSDSFWSSLRFRL